MADSHEEVTDQLNRRDFIKLTGGSGLFLYLNKFLQGLPLPSSPDHPTHDEAKITEPWEGRRFFESLETFNEQELIPHIKDELLQVPQLFSETSGQDFDATRWESDVNIYISQLLRIVSLRNGLKATGKSTPEALQLLQEDFYQMAVGAWMVLRTQEKYHQDKTRFIVGYRHSGLLADKSDPLLKEEIFRIISPWTKTNTVSDLFRGGLRQIAEPKWYKVSRQKENLPGGYEADPNLKDRPARTEIVAEDHPELVAAVEKILEEVRLDRVARAIEVISNESNAGGSHDPNIRSISLFLGNLDELVSHPDTLKAFTYHEATHSVQLLLTFLQSDQKILQHRLAINRIMDSFSVYQSLEAYFQPQGEYVSRFIGPEVNLDTEDTRARILNFAGVTDYPATAYSSPMLRPNKDTESYTEEINRFLNLEGENGLFQRLLTNSQVNPASFATFVDYFAAFYADTQTRASELSHIERYVLETIQQSVTLFDARERGFYYKYIGHWSQYLQEKVFPFVLDHLMRQDFEKVKELFAPLCPDEPTKQRVMHRLELYNLENRRDTSSEHEGFPEVIQCALRRHDPEVSNELPEQVWAPVDAEFKALLDDLIMEGIAKNSSGPLQM